jgi:hypothetical protein
MQYMQWLILNDRVQPSFIAGVHTPAPLPGRYAVYVEECVSATEGCPGAMGNARSLARSLTGAEAKGSLPKGSLANGSAPAARKRAPGKLAPPQSYTIPQRTLSAPAAFCSQCVRRNRVRCPLSLSLSDQLRCLARSGTHGAQHMACSMPTAVSSTHGVQYTVAGHRWLTAGRGSHRRC